MSCCLTFLFYNCLAGVFVFLILGIFTVTNNPFLILMNIKEKDGKKEYTYDGKKNAYLQYFLASVFNLLFGFLIWYIPRLKETIANKKRNKSTIKKEMQIFNDNKEKSDETDKEKLYEDSDLSNSNIEINTTNTNLIEKYSINKTSTEKNIENEEKNIENVGMTEKVEY